MTTLTKAPQELAPAAGAPASVALVGQPIPQLEDTAILTGQARYTDDLPIKPGTLHADGPVTESSTFGGAGDYTDVLGHDVRVP